MTNAVANLTNAVSFFQFALAAYGQGACSQEELEVARAEMFDAKSSYYAWVGDDARADAFSLAALDTWCDLADGRWS